MRAALANDDPLDTCPAYRAGFSSAVIHSKVILILTTAIHPVERGAVAANAFLQDFANRFMQRLSLLYRDRIRCNQRMQFCEMQRFIRINIAKSGKKRLVKQQGLEQTMSVVECPVEPSGCEASAQGFRSKFAKYIFRAVCEPDAPEFARIVEYQVAQIAIVRGQAQDQPVMFFGLNFTLFDQEIATHPQVNEEAEIRQPEDKVFRASCYILDNLSSDQSTEFSHTGKCKRSSPAQTRILDRLSDQVWLELTDNRLDFG